MNSANEAIRYLFILALFLIAVAYFSGFVADTKAVGGAVGSLLQIATGRNNQGTFAGYPTGASVALQPAVFPASTQHGSIPTQVSA